MKKYSGNILPDRRAGFRFSRVYAAVLFLAAAWFFSILVVPFWIQGGAVEKIMAGLIRYFFAPICHQLPEKSFRLWGHPMAVCSRCSGIYAGFVFGLYVYPFARRLGEKSAPPLEVLWIAAMPTLMEWFLVHLNVIESSNPVRSLTGFVLGAAVVFWVLPAVFQWVDPKNSIKRREKWLSRSAS